MTNEDLNTLADDVIDFCNALEAAAVNLKMQIAKLFGPCTRETKAPSIPESTFNILKWDPGKGEKLGEFEVAFKNSNIPDNWSHAFNILKANNATLKNHLGSEEWACYYWLYLQRYNDRIFRKQRKTKRAL